MNVKDMQDEATLELRKAACKFMGTHPTDENAIPDLQAAALAYAQAIDIARTQSSRTRERLATALLTGIVAGDSNFDMAPEEWDNQAYEFADAIIAARIEVASRGKIE